MKTSQHAVREMVRQGVINGTKEFRLVISEYVSHRNMKRLYSKTIDAVNQGLSSYYIVYVLRCAQI